MAGDALTFRVAFVVRWLLWVVRFVVIWPLATMALMALFVLWKDNTTLGKWHCCKVSDEAAFCLIQRPYISKTLLT
ncbi:conjugal transfer protein TraP, partial [Escherichia coli]|nr:conjugal transfer protein TraP [Escherichia coli]MDB6951096.1 conjugal transfer protein TraP [Escherichia coli]MDB6955991.1 conjugal transfer protein TraP [Escherichia coli]MDB6960576.1 conjugal transfer protein TraP [Escherichia coli]MDB6965475.1 conjugal transfer protein TraP [Escherichia coli]